MFAKDNFAAFFWICFFAAAAADQAVKFAVLSGFRWDSAAISITLAFNTGVAFSLFAEIGEYLKYIQTALVAIALAYVFRAKLLTDRVIAAGIGTLLGAGSSNILDRFMHGGVVDYVYWHYWFDFAIFNLADALIDFSIALLLFRHFRGARGVS